MIINIFNISIPLEALIPLIFIIFFLGSAIIVFLKNTSKNIEENTEQSMQKIIIALNFQNIKKVSNAKFTGVYMNKEIVFEYAIVNEFPYLNIEMQFSDNTEPRFITTFYFSLTGKVFNLKWNSFENTFSIIGSSAPSFNSEIKLNLECLFNKGYFTQYTTLSAWPPNKNRGFGKIIFELPWDIIEKGDTGSVKLALDIVVRIADQMARK